MATEYWMSGPVDNIPALLQPVAHALLQANLEINTLMQDFPEEKLWEKPAGIASPGFHLQHVSGVLDRLCTYARAEALSEAQLAALKAEGTPGPSLHDLLEQFDAQVHKTLLQLSATPENTLTEFRGVGRKQLPSTVLGLLFHAAEHTMRHTGQLLVTVKVLS
ncbi:DinB family protein [Chitinophaga polysaccharea]|uniref:DinB family protein n=1 Tax=Chitinophaga polysaccharea TaxID=1293035 RepID=A0A561PLE8_9BACT|nr:DinB family protein [Chitinophaga polysaccharea]TWF38943.1 DinB family protein [Chitinophaga polysaccharea]